MAAIEGKVTLIVDERTLVLNRGHKDGVRHGMAFAVVGPMDNVKDPDTDEDLGPWEGVKARLVAVHVQERVSVLAPAETGRALSEYDLHHTLSAEMVRVSMADVGQTDLDIDRGQMSGMPRLGPIRRGDVVRQME